MIFWSWQRDHHNNHCVKGKVAIALVFIAKCCAHHKKWQLRFLVPRVSKMI